MNAPRIAWWIFIVGLIPLAFVTRPLRESLGDWLAFAIAISYLVLLRFGGEIVERRLRARKEPEHET